MKKKFWILLWLSCFTLPAAKYPSGLHWREINRGGFTVIFPAARFMEAEAALAKAEDLNERLSAFWRAALQGRIRIVLDDSTDQANGFATFFPFNLVGVNLAEPPPDSELAASRGWLDLVLAHELTHLFTLNAAAETFIKLRRVFGSQPALYPAVQLPPWVIEGLAVYGESRFTGDGRLNHPPYPLMLGAARRDRLFPDWNRVAGTPAAWPGPASKYLFGAGFMQFLATRYGADTLRQYLERSTSRLVLLSSSRDFKKTFGEPLGKLWRQYQNDPPAAVAAVAVGFAPAPLPTRGFPNLYPCPLGENMLVYYRRDYRGRGAVAMLDMKSGREKMLFKMDAVNGLSFAAKENKILLSATDFFHAFNDFTDLYEFDLNKRQLKRLSRGQRLSQPVKNKNSNEIFCVQRRDGRYFLALFNMRTRSAKTLSRGFTGLSQLSLSPDQSLLAASVKPEGEPWGIGVFSTAGELRTFVTAVGADCRQPCWQNNQTLCFIQNGTKTSRLASLSLAGKSVSVCDDLRLYGLQQFSLGGDGQDIFYTYFSGRGLEIARLDLAGLRFSPQELGASASVPEKPAAAPQIVSRPYRPLRDLLPRWWSPALRSGGDEIQAGIMTGGQDALGIHAFSLEGYYGLSSQRPNILFRYVYDGLLPTLSIAYSDDSAYYRDNDYSLRSQEWKLVSSWPLRVRRRSQLYGYADLHLARRTYIPDSGAYEYSDSFNGIRFGLEFNSAREYYDSISPADGARLSLQYSLQPAGLGNEFASRSVQADLRHYIPLFRPGVLAWRLALARSWNDPYGFSLGGAEGEPGSSLGRNHPFDLLRGFPAGYDWGKGGYLFNLEYRLPLFKIEKAVLPAVSLDRVYLNAFFDMGRLWHQSYASPAAYSVGTEVVLRLAFGGAAAFDLSFGAAYGFGPEKHFRLYLRTGRSF